MALCVLNDLLQEPASIDAILEAYERGRRAAAGDASDPAAKRPRLAEPPSEDGSVDVVDHSKILMNKINQNARRSVRTRSPVSVSNHRVLCSIKTK